MAKLPEKSVQAAWYLGFRPEGNGGDGALLAHPQSVFVRLDWARQQDWDGLAAFLQRQTMRIETVIAWVHSPYEPLLIRFLNELEAPQRFEVYALKGSSSRPSTLADTAAYRVRFVRLGRHASGRWLTHQEISTTLMAAVEGRTSVTAGDWTV